MMSSNVIEVASQSYQDQKPGTSGLRKKVTVFQQPNYIENFTQAILLADHRPLLMVLGGDGRYYSREAIDKIINVCVANGVQRIVIPKGGILSTPAASAMIRSLEAEGGIILTASHNPGGKEGDFGIKYNSANGGPANETLTNKIYELARQMPSYRSCIKRPHVDIDTIDVNVVCDSHVDIVDPVSNYTALMKEVFDFYTLKRLFIRQPNRKLFKILVDPMNGVMGPYVERILVKELGAQASCLINGKPLEDFGGKHPDPNLTYAKELVDTLKADSEIDIGVAFDGDGDRNMILGQNAFFVTPGDSLAVLAHHHKLIKFFREPNRCNGFARSFPTAPAVDRVAEKQNVLCYETPTGWKYFGNLMDSGRIGLCGEESFGTGSNHIREKDGLWACLAWLTIMEATGKTVRELVEDHWRLYGRDYFCRYDFEECDAGKCESMMKQFESLMMGQTLVGKKFGQNDRYEVASTGNFEYVDPVDNSVSSKQGLYVKFVNGARIILRLSGTGSSGATVRLYVSDYSSEKLYEDSQVYLKELLDIAYEISKLPEYTGRDKPTVIT